jgi:hypothetical protein
MNYSIYFDFIESYLPTGFRNIKASDPIVQKMEEEMELNNQYISVIECGTVNFLYTSKGSLPLIGVDPIELNPTHYLEVTHPDDIHILEWARIQLFRMEQEIFKAKKGSALFSYPLRMKNASGEYHQFLGQDYFIYGATPRPAVYALQIGTVIDWCDKKKFNSHRYIGNDPSFFRFPDEELLKTRLNYSPREMEIIKLIALGLSSEQIADKLFLSIHTVNTHRSNILERSGKASLMDLIFELKDQGLL